MVLPGTDWSSLAEVNAVVCLLLPALGMLTYYQAMKEKTLWDKFSEGCPKKDVRLLRVENAAGVGFPDVVYCSEGVTGWIELKAAENQKPPWRNVYQPEQPLWHMMWKRAGGLSFVLSVTSTGERVLLGEPIKKFTLLDALLFWDGPKTPWERLLPILRNQQPEFTQ